MKRYDLIVIGAGPAGLSAAIEAAGYGLKVAVFDENEKPGGQLFKQIHKFFGSKEHHAKIRGFNIGKELLSTADELGVDVILRATVIGIYPLKEVVVNIASEVIHYKADAIIIATGASENMIQFNGWTKPGVIGAGAAQTMMNLHGIKPGNKILMLGSGNVGLVVSYQLLQAGCEVVGIVDAAPRVGGYGVHAAKVARTGVPFYLSHTIIEATGSRSVDGVIIGEVDRQWQVVEGSEKKLDVDTICLAVGLSPMSQLCIMAGCDMVEDPARGGTVPVCNERGETSISGIFVAGDVSGIEEASSAMIEGRIAGASVATKLGYMDAIDIHSVLEKQDHALLQLRQGMFAPGMKGKAIEYTDEGIPIADNLLTKGYMTEEEVLRYPGIKEAVGIHPVIECSQNIPCNPCQDSCPKGCIKIGSTITALPVYDNKTTCIGCGMCVAACSGQSIFLLHQEAEPGYSYITMPYEFLPLPVVGEQGFALNRKGEVVCNAEIIRIQSLKAFDHTHLVTMKVPHAMGMSARFYRKSKEVV